MYKICESQLSQLIVTKTDGKILTLPGEPEHGQIICPILGCNY